MATQRNGRPRSLSLHPALEQAELEKCWILCPGCALALSAPSPCDVPTFVTRYILIDSSGTISLLRPDSVPPGRACRVPISTDLAQPSCSAQPSTCPLPCMHYSIIHSPLGVVAACVSFTRLSTTRQALFLSVCISSVYISE